MFVRIESLPEQAAELLDSVRQIAPTLREYAHEADQTHRLAAASLAAIQDIGLSRMAAPRSLGGFEIDPISSFAIIEELARADPAVAWNVLACTGAIHIMSGGIEATVLRELWTDGPPNACAVA